MGRVWSYDAACPTACVSIANAFRENRMIKWWFTRGLGSLVTIPVFILLLVGTAGAFFQGFVQTLAYFRVFKAVFGWMGFVVCLFVWPFSLIVPGAMWWSTIREVPRVILKEATSRQAVLGYFLAGVIFLPGCASVIQWAHGRVISWAADRNPCAAFNAGVTGSKPPVNCR